MRFEALAISYDCSAREFKAGQSLLYSPQRQEVIANSKQPAKKAPFGRGLVGWMLFVGLAIMFFLLMRRRDGASVSNPVQPVQPLSDALGMWGFYVALTGLAMIAVGWLMVRSGLHRTNLAAKKGITYTLTDSGITESSPDVTTQFVWERFHSFAVTETVLVLRISSGQGFILPIRLFTAEQLAKVQELLQERIVVKPPTIHTGFEVVQP